MSPLLLLASITLLLLLGAVLGPRLLRAAAPVLMRVPRLAVALLMMGLGAWLLTAAALSLVLAWTLSGPRLLPGAYGEVCQRCLAASSPFAPGHTVETALPVRSEEHTSELQSRGHLVCRLLLEKKRTS